MYLYSGNFCVVNIFLTPESTCFCCPRTCISACSPRVVGSAINGFLVASLFLTNLLFFRVFNFFLLHLFLMSEDFVIFIFAIFWNLRNKIFTLICFFYIKKKSSFNIFPNFLTFKINFIVHFEKKKKKKKKETNQNQF